MVVTNVSKCFVDIINIDIIHLQQTFIELCNISIVVLQSITSPLYQKMVRKYSGIYLHIFLLQSVLHLGKESYYGHEWLPTEKNHKPRVFLVSSLHLLRLKRDGKQFKVRVPSAKIGGVYMYIHC